MIGTLRNLALAACVALTALAAPAAAQDAYPTKPITMIVPFAAGGASDVIARLIAEQMGQHLGQRFVIENVAGAGGSTAMTRAARAPNDGYTVIIGNSGTATAGSSRAMATRAVAVSAAARFRSISSLWSSRAA